MTKSLFDLSCRTAIVTGATKGIGRAIAFRMAEAGAEVVVSSRDEGRCRDAADEITAAGGRAIGIPVNISHIEKLDGYLDRVREQISHPVTVFVGNAAVNPYYGSIVDIEEAAFDRIYNANVKSTLWMVRRLTPEMKEHGGGAIIFVTSISALRGTDDIGAYGASKAALTSVARSLAVGLGPDGIRANCIAPGLIKTDFAKPLLEDPEKVAAVERRYPLRRIGEPDDLAGAAVFLASDASRFVTGQTIVVDGGVSIAGTGRL